jgi:hypothetical protein
MTEKRQEEKRLQEIASLLASWDLELLVHPKNAGSYNFAQYRDFLVFMQSFFSELAGANFNFIPSNFISNIIQNCESLQSALTRLQNFNYQENDPNQISKQLFSQIQAQWQGVYAVTAEHLALAKVLSSSIREEAESMKAAISVVQAGWGKMSAESAAATATAEAKLVERTTELDKVLSAAREASALQGVSAQASEFEKEAGNCLEASQKWFWGTAAVVLLSAVLIWFMFIKAWQGEAGIAPSQAAGMASNKFGTPVESPSTSELPEHSVEIKGLTVSVVEQTVARILIVTLLYSAVVWCARNYFACRHNYTINRHRRNAMQTFRAFVEGTKDPATQDFILRQAAACAFAPQQSGYLKDESLPIPGPASQIIDIIKPGAK